MYVAEGRGRQKHGEEELHAHGGADHRAGAVRRPRSRRLPIGGDDLRRPPAGLDRVAATRLSFFLAIPALTGAACTSSRTSTPPSSGWGPLLLGTLVSFVVAYAAIAWLLRFVARHPITIFVWYRLAAGLLLALLLAAGVISAT